VEDTTTKTTQTRTRRPLTAGLAVGATLILACTKGPSAPELEADPARLLVGILGTCASAVRDVQVRRAGQAEWEPVTAGAVFRVGDEIRTGPRSAARIALLAGGALDLEDSAAVALDVKSSEDGAGRGGGRPLARSSADESRVAVKAGVVRGTLPQADRAASPAGFVILSGDGSEVRVASRPGEDPTRFRLVRQELGTELTVIQGAASVKGAKGGETILAAGQVAVARGGDLADRAELAQAPQLLEPASDARFQIAPGLSVRLRWKEVPGATGYLVQIAHDLSFREVERQEAATGPELLFTPGSAGARAWRVAARDASGRLGEYGAGRRLHVEVRTPRDLLQKPPDATVIKAGDRGASVSLSWLPVGDGAQYRVVLARGPELSPPVTSAVVGGDHTVVEIDEPGEYWWGVYVEEDGDLRPVFTRPRRLSVRKAGEPRPRGEARSEPRMEVPRAISQWGN
jgi:hypothetical protein